MVITIRVTCDMLNCRRVSALKGVVLLSRCTMGKSIYCKMLESRVRVVISDIWCAGYEETTSYREKGIARRSTTLLYTVTYETNPACRYLHCTVTRNCNQR